MVYREEKRTRRVDFFSWCWWCARAKKTRQDFDQDQLEQKEKCETGQRIDDDLLAVACAFGRCAADHDHHATRDHHQHCERYDERLEQAVGLQDVALESVRKRHGKISQRESAEDQDLSGAVRDFFGHFLELENPSPRLVSRLGQSYGLRHDRRHDLADFIRVYVDQLDPHVVTVPVKIILDRDVPRSHTVLDRVDEPVVANFIPVVKFVATVNSVFTNAYLDRAWITVEPKHGHGENRDRGESEVADELGRGEVPDERADRHDEDRETDVPQRRAVVVNPVDRPEGGECVAVRVDFVERHDLDLFYGNLKLLL